MPASFRIYIDEAGCEGFKFRQDLAVQSSSDWFVLGAFITRKETDLETVKVIDAVREEFGIPSKKHVHWKDLKHPQKVRYSQRIAGQKARAIMVCVHKPSLLEPETFQERYQDNTSGYGLKIVPREATAYIKEQESLKWLHEVK